jgi:hypothetical protein
MCLGGSAHAPTDSAQAPNSPRHYLFEAGDAFGVQHESLRIH